MKERAIVAGISMFMMLGTVGGLEQGSMALGQACVMGGIGTLLMVLSMRRWK